MKKRFWVAIILAVILVSALVIPISATLTNQTNENTLDQTASITMPSDSELVNGLWYQDIDHPIFVGGYQVSFMKIYSGFKDYNGKSLPNKRVMELSSYPRAYIDKEPHVYTVDTPFVVTQDDLNDYYNIKYALDGGYKYREDIPEGTNVFVDFIRLVFQIGETATHYAGESLPGCFPMWLESETLPTPPWVDNKNTVLPMVYGAVKGQLVTTAVLEAVYKQQGDTSWTPLPAQMLETSKTAVSDATTEIRINKITQNKDRTILRILYDKVIN
jgi:hypothetical protein